MRYAVIDIGSNAIRTVVYSDNSINASELYNKKFSSDLPSLLDLENLEVKHSIYLIIEHFLHIFERLEVKSIKCAATAILRNHNNADKFVSIVKKLYNLDIEVITGTKEAYITAAGLIMGVNDANGIVADLGGGSLELAEIFNKEVGSRASFPLGINIIARNISIAEVKETILKAYQIKEYKNLYLIGGAFRLLAKFYIEYVKYSINNLHNFTIKANKFLSFFDSIETMFFDHTFVNKINVDYKSIIIIKALIELFKIENITISNYGLKEGVRFVNLPNDQKFNDVVKSKIISITNFNHIDCDMESYYKVVSKLLIDSNAHFRYLMEVTMMLSTLDISIDQISKAEILSEIVLNLNIPFSYKDRLIVTIALYCIFGYKPSIKLHHLARKILSNLEYNNSKIIGYFLSIACELDGPSFSKPSFDFEIKESYIELDSQNILPKQIFIKVAEKLKQIGWLKKI